MKSITVIFTFIAILNNAQTFADYRTQYDNYEENDVRAFKFLNPYIRKAKKENNHRELTQAYRDAVSFSTADKMQYADSAILSALSTHDDNLIGNAYLTKGSIYYFNYKKFTPALDQYLKAWNYLEKSEDKYLHYKNLYHIGVVKSYLGYYEESLQIFNKCQSFYGNQKTGQLPNLNYNLKKGYLNSLHQSIICLTHLSSYEDALKDIKLGLKMTYGDIDFYLERSYFYKSRGIIEFKMKKYDAALQSFDNALAGIEKKNDFATASQIYFYRGKALLEQQKIVEGVESFQKIDSVFIKNSFILPEVREFYEYLIEFHKNKNEDNSQLYYTTQLLKADKVISADYKYLAGKIYKEFDTKELLDSKNKLEKSISYSFYLNMILVAVSLIIVIIAIRYWKKIKIIYKTEQAANDVEENLDNDSPKRTSKHFVKISEKLIKEILAKLENMENNHFFLEKGVTQNKLASKLKTNTAYLSYIINEYKGNNFNSYINRLRIDYAAEMLSSHKLWRNYTVETIAQECGFTNRTNFSKVFAELKGITITDYIEKCKDPTEVS